MPSHNVALMMVTAAVVSNPVLRGREKEEEEKDLLVQQSNASVQKNKCSLGF